MDLAGRGIPADSAYSATQISRVSADTREKQERDAKVDVCNRVVTWLSAFGQEITKADIRDSRYSY